MARTSTGYITLYDVNDGTNPITAYLTNSNHTFAGPETGAFSSTIVQGFNSGLDVFIGLTQATYDNTSPFGDNTYRITSVNYINASTGTTITPAGWGAISADSSGNITVASIGAAAVTSVTARVTFTVRESSTREVTGLTLDITLGTVRAGSGGNTVNITQNRGSFLADGANALLASQDMVILQIDRFGNTTNNVTVETSIDGGAFTSRTGPATSSTNPPQGSIAGYDTDLTGNPITTGNWNGTTVRRLFISQQSFSSANTFTVRVTGDDGGTDSINIFRVRQGTPGNDAISVVINSSDNAVFRNAAGTAKTLTARVYDQADASEITTGVTYQWHTATGTNIQINNTTDREVVASGGVNANTQTIVVGAEDVTGQADFGCTVNVT